jgi:hypothetical protein
MSRKVSLGSFGLALVVLAGLLPAKPARAGFGDDLRDVGRIFEAIECAVEDRDCDDYDYRYRGGHRRRDGDYRYDRDDRYDRQRERERKQQRAEREAFDQAYERYYDRYHSLSSRQKQIAAVVFEYNNRSTHPTAQGLDDVLKFNGWYESDRQLAQEEYKFLVSSYKRVAKHLREKLTSKIQSLYWYRNY